jgi:glycine/D-amino acid oxidase-like deaminating enzyme
VVVLDQEGIGAGESGRTTAHLTSVLDERYAHLLRLHGDRNARLAAASHLAALDLVDSVVRAESLECGFEWVDGYLFGGSSEALPDLEEELEAARSVGLPADLLARAPLPFESGPALRFPDQAQFHPMRYLAGLSRAIGRRGGNIVRARAVHFEGDEKEAVVKTERGPSVRSAALVIATHAPVHQGFSLLVKQAPYRS